MHLEGIDRYWVPKPTLESGRVELSVVGNSRTPERPLGGWSLFWTEIWKFECFKRARCQMDKALGLGTKRPGEKSRHIWQRQGSPRQTSILDRRVPKKVKNVKRKGPESWDKFGQVSLKMVRTGNRNFGNHPLEFSWVLK